MRKDGLDKIELPGIEKYKSGKVRDLYAVDDKLLLIASDRISAFDVIMQDPIPDKGTVLTQMSLFWFDYTRHIVANHVITADVSEYPKELQKYREILQGRSLLAKKTQVLPVECVVRGYLAGSGWKEYQKTRSVCGVRLPEGLREADQLPEPIFTPSTKAETGHDENITVVQMKQIIGAERAEQVIEVSKKIYTTCAEYAKVRGLIIADTKFEFGLLGEELILIDEILTPDSSRFWPMDQYKPGQSQMSYDKQYLRDYLETLDWPKTPPAPRLPQEIIEKTREKYVEAYEKITGKPFAG